MDGYEAWKLAKKIFNAGKPGGFTSQEFNLIFGNMSKYEVLELDPEEVERKLKEYEDSKKIKVGDVVTAFNEDVKYLVLDEDINNGIKVFCLFSENGCVETIKGSALKKCFHTEWVDKLLNSIRGY